MTISIHVRYRLLIVSVIAALSVVLSGCQGSAAPGGSSSPPSTSSLTSAASIPSATQTPTAPPAYKPADASGKAQNVPVPEKPALADENSKAGLEAFTKYWYELLSYGYETGDVSGTDELSSKGCQFCIGLGDGIREAWQDKRWIAGGKIQSRAVNIQFVVGMTTQQITMQIIQEKIQIIRPDGTLLQDPTPQTNVASQVVADFDGTRWIVVDLGLVR